MKFQKVKMVVEFDVPVGREAYSPRFIGHPWQEFAEHDMLDHLKECDAMADRFVFVSDVDFEWGKKFEKKADWEE